MEEHINIIIGSISAFFGVIVAYFLGIFALLGTGIAALTALLMSLWAMIATFFAWLLPASFISAISGLFTWVYPIVAKIAPFITVSKGGKNAITWIKKKLKK